MDAGGNSAGTLPEDKGRPRSRKPLTKKSRRYNTNKAKPRPIFEKEKRGPVMGPRGARPKHEMFGQ